MKMPSYLKIISAILLGGCEQISWQKYGATEQDFRVTSYECEKDARQSHYFTTNYELRSFFIRCMEAKGWRAVSVHQEGTKTISNPQIDSKQIYNSPPPPKADVSNYVKCNATQGFSYSTSPERCRLNGDVVEK